MGDGTNSYGAMLLQTQSFTLQECVFIVNVLKVKFDLDCTIQKSREQHTVYISTASMRRLYPKISPFMVDTMRYKLAGD